MKFWRALGAWMLKILPVVLGSVLFIPVSCSMLALASANLHIEKLDPDSRPYPSFFHVAAMSEGAVKYVMLYDLPKFKSEHQNYSFILPNTSDKCESYICYRVISDTGIEQVIEVEEKADGLIGYAVWSRYRATHSDFAPISLLRKNVTSAFGYALYGSFAICAIGRAMRKKPAIKTPQHDGWANPR